MSERSSAYEDYQDDEGGQTARQLRLLPGGARRRDWALDEHTRSLGRRGIAAAREVLRAAQPPEPKQPAPERRAS
jgi:hypothetical protein